MIDDIANNGENAYHIGVTKNPYPASSPLNSIWQQGWNGAKALDKGFSK